MERNKPSADNSTFSGTLNAATNSIPFNVPRYGRTTENIVGSILSQIEEHQPGYQELGQEFHNLFSGNAAGGERMTDVVNSSTQTLISEREGDLVEDEDAGRNRNMQNMFYEAFLEHTTHIKIGLRLMIFYLSIKLHKYQLPKSTCLDSKERCSICLDDYYDEEKLAEIDCGHVYHIDCIKEWIKLNNSCPICKTDVLAILT